jgi:microsomal dipeptidase-like Zn-dependent dipeptidase
MLHQLVICLLAAATLSGCAPLARVVDARFNAVVGRDSTAPPADGEAELEAFFRSLFIADLHADSFLWDRDLARRQDRGHIDLERLCAGNVAFQVFAAPTRYSPPTRGADGRPYHDEHAINLIGALWALQAASRPWRSIWDLEERALVQGAALFALSAGTAPEAPRELTVVRNAQELGAFVERWRGTSAAGSCSVGAMLALEGIHFVSGRPQALDRLLAAGFRMASPTHHFDNPLAGSSTGRLRYGLTAEGRAVLDRLIRSGIIIDLAHASDATIDDTLAALHGLGSRAPVLVSHTGIRRHCPDAAERNISDCGVREVARAGGIIGVIYWPQQLCRRDDDERTHIIGGIVEALNAIDDLLRPLSRVRGCTEACIDDPTDHMALGSDWDGGIPSPIDASGTRLLIRALRAERRSGCSEGPCRRYSDDQIRKIAGRNACRFLAASLPGGDRDAASRLCRNLARAAP